MEGRRAVCGAVVGSGWAERGKALSKGGGSVRGHRAEGWASSQGYAAGILTPEGVSDMENLLSDV